MNDKVNWNEMLMKVSDWPAISKGQKEDFGKEVLNQIGNGKKLLGLHIVGTGKFDHNPESGEWDVERTLIVYFMYHTDNEANNFYIRGFVAGQTLQYVAERSFDVEEPEQHTYVSRIDGRFRYREEDGSMLLRVDYVDTKYDFRRKGLARHAFGYLRNLAVEKKAYKVRGEMDADYRALGLHTFYEKMGFEITFPEEGNPIFSINP